MSVLSNTWMWSDILMMMLFQHIVQKCIGICHTQINGIC